MAFHQKKGIREHVTIVFEDESGYSERPTVRRTWAPKGKTPIIASSGSWKTRTAIGLIACTPNGKHPRFFLKIIRGSARVPDFISMLKNLKRHIRGRIFLIWDGLPGHRSKAVREYTAANRKRLSVFRFPAYAPEFNPVEYSWSSSKTKDFANHVPKDIAALEARIRKSALRIRKNPDLLSGFLKKSGLFDG